MGELKGSTTMCCPSFVIGGIALLCRYNVQRILHPANPRILRTRTTIVAAAVVIPLLGLALIVGSFFFFRMRSRRNAGPRKEKESASSSSRDRACHAELAVPEYELSGTEEVPNSLSELEGSNRAEQCSCRNNR